MISVHWLVICVIGASSSCTEHTYCINKLTAFDFDFDYLLEVTTDCEIDPGKKLKLFMQHTFNIKKVQAWKKVLFYSQLLLWCEAKRNAGNAPAMHPPSSETRDGYPTKEYGGSAHSIA